MAKRLEQAEHNKKLSEKLYIEKVFLDWANTTAFYSALHFVHHKLLPGVYNNVNCLGIDDVVRAFRSKSKHEATSQLVKKGLPNVGKQYSYLLNSSFTARYVDYKVHPEQAKICQKYLKQIKAACVDIPNSE